MRASTLDRNLLFCTVGVSLRSTSLRFPELLVAVRPANSEVVSACAIFMASFASAGKKILANATELVMKLALESTKMRFFKMGRGKKKKKPERLFCYMQITNCKTKL